MGKLVEVRGAVDFMVKLPRIGKTQPILHRGAVLHTHEVVVPGTWGGGGAGRAKQSETGLCIVSCDALASRRRTKLTALLNRPCMCQGTSWSKGCWLPTMICSRVTTVTQGKRDLFMKLVQRWSLRAASRCLPGK
eukprot:1141629-Pelagomonas_calceolata.AAC.10